MGDGNGEQLEGQGQKEENTMSMEQDADKLTVRFSDLKAEYESHYQDAQISKSNTTLALSEWTDNAEITEETTKRKVSLRKREETETLLP